MPAMFPVFLDLDGRDILVGGGGTVAESKTRGLLDAGGRCCTARSKSLTSLCRSESHPTQ